MINRELIEVFSEIAREKNVERSELGNILEQLFLYIIEKQYGDASNCSVIVNLDKGEIEIYSEKTIVEEVNDPLCEITLEEVLKKDPELTDLQVGDPYVEVVDPAIFGRRIIATAKQFFNQRLQDVEKRYIYEDYSQKVGEIVIGVVHQVQKENVFINIEQAELRMPRREQIPSERYRRGDTIRAIVKSVEVTSHGPDIIVSRSDNHFLYKLFEMEVPEIDDGVIEILAIARHPGERAKIIVRSQDKRIDPVGACVGMRGSRIQAIVRELNNEKIDIVNYSAQPEILISRALSPAKPAELYIDNDRRYCVALFNDEELEFAIGKGGVNINLASQVTNYKIDAFGKKEYEKQQRDQNTLLKDIPNFPQEIADNLQQKGIHTISDLTGTDEELLLKTKGMTEERLETIYSLIQAFIESEDEKALTVEEVLDELDSNGATEEKEEVADSTSVTSEPVEKVGDQES